MYVALPTTDIVRNFKEFDRLFSFYEGGIKGVVRDTVLLSAAWVLDHPSWIFDREIMRYPGLVAHYDTKHPITTAYPVIADGLLEKIMRDYANSPEAMMQRFSENTSSENYVEIVAEMIDRAVGEMMNTLFRSSVYDICKTEWQWIGDDLVAKIKIYNRPQRSGFHRL